jgi:hypothetical protein
MHARLVPAFAFAAVLCAAGGARASCPVALDGDPALVEQVRTELAAFGDDGTPCVPLSAQCRRHGDVLEVAVSDASGRSAQRTFASTAGAAAFIVSWSLHPPTDLGVTQRPAAPAITTAAALPDRAWHPEVALGYLGTSGIDRSWATLAASIDKRIEHLRVGGGLRALAGNPISVANIDLELRVGGVWDLATRWSLRAEATGARTLLTVSSKMPSVEGYGAEGFRGGLRALVAWQPEGPVGFEIGAGYDWMRTVSPEDTGTFGHGPAAGFWRLDVGVRWVP